MPEFREGQSCSYCGGATGPWPRVQPVITCSCCQQPLLALAPSMQRVMGASNLPALKTANWLLSGLLPIALALHLSGAEWAAEQVVAYVLFGAVGVFSWMALAKLRSGVSRTFRVVYRGSANALISPILLIAMAACMTLAATSIDNPRTDVPGATAAPRLQSLPPSRG